MCSKADPQGDHGYQRPCRSNVKIIVKSSDDRRRNSTYSMHIANRFTATLSGNTPDVGQIKRVTQKPDLPQLGPWSAQES